MVESTPRAVFPALLRNEKSFSLQTWQLCFIDKWVTICTIKLEDRPFHVAMVIAQIKGVQNDIFKKSFFTILTTEMKAATIS